MMRQQFLQDIHVREFAAWLADRLPRFTVRTRISVSPYLPQGLVIDAPLDQLVPDHYRWRFTGMATGDWTETALRMRELSIALRAAAALNDATATRDACEAIVSWGADRNSRVGASAYLASLGDALPDYLRMTAGLLRLTEPDPTGTFRGVPRMNSSLCKIHTLFAADGLPIYESRVAAAIGTLVEIWRRETGQTAEPLPLALRFPAVGNQLQRRVRSVFADAVDPGVLSYNLSSEIATAARWASAAVRLGLLLEETLRLGRSDGFLAWPRHQEPQASVLVGRLYTFVGALFMAGYDPRCLRDAAARG